MTRNCIKSISLTLELCPERNIVQLLLYNTNRTSLLFLERKLGGAGDRETFEVVRKIFCIYFLTIFFWSVILQKIIYESINNRFYNNDHSLNLRAIYSNLIPLR